MSDWGEQVRAAAVAVRPYPDSMLEIPYAPFGVVQGRAFFPGGTGSIELSATSRNRPTIMIVGNDFGSAADYEHAAKQGEEDDAGTWSGLLTILSRAGIDPATCFFTNAIPGARRFGTKNTGTSPALSHRPFVSRCAAFLIEQVRIVDPTGLVMLGKNQRLVLAAAFQTLSGMSRCNSWKDIDAAKLQWIDNLLPGGSRRIRFCAIMHSSMRSVNIKRQGRQFKGLLDDDAEIDLLRRVSRD